VLQQLADEVSQTFDYKQHSQQRKLKDYQLLSQAEYQQIVYDWNQTDKAYPKDKTIQQLFEEQVQRTPDNVAVVFEEQNLTYRDLNTLANQLAHKIRNEYYEQTKQQLVPDTLIALCLDRSLEMIVAILAVLKAGGAYVPLDSGYPDDRISYTMEDTNTALVLTQTQHVDKLSQLTDAKLFDITDYSNYQNELYTAPAIKTKPTNLAYVIYTSGTTGRPKGVMIEHHSLTALLFAINNKLNLENNLTKIPFVFDPFIRESFYPLITGNCLFIAKERYYQDVEYLVNECIKNKIDSIYFVPSHLELFVEYLIDLPKDKLKKITLKTINSCGEVLKNKLVNVLRALLPGIVIHNQYGPTEACQYSFQYEIVNDDYNSYPSIPVGVTLMNKKAYVLDVTHTPVPVGVIGELYIAGAGLARGYLNNPELTAERFIPNPFASELDLANGYTRMYKTGDLVRWLPDGNLEYIGRNDFQVKIRGFRVELGEIEEQLLEIPQIRQACVVAKTKTEASQQYLSAYYVLDKDLSCGENLSHDQILGKLGLVLPDYMLPSALMELESLPLTINGKLDRRALPDVEFTNSRNYVAPESELEQTIAQIWCEILGLEKVGIHDDFFRCGGNSILAIRAVHQISQVLDLHLHVADIFKYKTIQSLIKHLEGSDTQQAIAISPASLEHYPLSFAQGRLWFIEQYEAGTNAYHIPMLVELAPNVDIAILKQSIQAIVARHEILRTTFVKNIDGDYYQKVQTAELEISEYNFNDNTLSSSFEQQLDLDVNTPFELNTSNPIRVSIYQVKNDCAIGNNKVIVKSQLKQPRLLLLINVHHIASDGWSMDILVKEIYAYYDYFSNPKAKLDLPNLPIQYKDFAYWQRNYLSGDILHQQLDYWQQRLADYEPLMLPIDKARPALVNYSGKSISFSLDAEYSDKLRSIARAQNCSLYSVLLSGFYVLLSKYSNQDDIVIGTPFANRHYNQIENLIGFFVNTLVLRARVNPDDSMIDLIQQVHRELIHAQGHQDLPFEKLVDHLNVEKDLSRNPIFQVLFGVQGFGKSDNKQQLFKVVDINQLNYYNVAKFDLECFMDDSESIISGFFKYATALYEESTIERMIAHYQLILQQLADEVSQTLEYKQHYQQRKLKDYQLLSPADYQQIVYDWNQTDKAYPKDKTLHQLFEDQVQRTPDNVAVVFEEKFLTYRELNTQANQLAHKIRNEYYEQTKQQLVPDTLIVLCLDRSLEMIVAILAVLKAGGAYVPLDPEYPDERIAYILQDTQAKLLLTQSQHLARLNQILNTENVEFSNRVNNTATSVNVEIQGECGNSTMHNLAHAKIMLLDIANYSSYQDETATELGIISKSDNLAYVIYTSGTTGRPKGVMIEHGGVVNLSLDIMINHKLNICKELSIYSNYIFDAFIYEVFPALLNGNKLFILNDKLRYSLIEFSAYIDANNIKSTFIPAILIKDFIEALTNNYSLELIYTGGERFHELNYSRINSKLIILNEYGPTESTVCATLHRYSAGDLSNNIGKSIINTKLYVLNNNHMPVPVGVIGELYIAGAGLARGYLNNPELTAECFIPNPFASELDLANGYTRMYKTGDLVRLLPDGNLEYIGRNDFQVKIRGFRVELGEIEEQLLEIPQIRQACVIAKTKTETSQQYLAAYYVLNKDLSYGEALSAEQILVKLGLALPDYMLPSALMELESLPLTISGKLDRRALPDVEFTNSRNYVAPESELEQTIAQIWCEILGLEKVGIHDNFFKLGGNSLNSIQLVTRIRQELNLDLRVADIFIKPTIAKLLTNAQSIIQELDNCYFIGSNIQTQESMTIVCIPGFLKEFELTYIELVHELHKYNVNANIYTLKTKFYQFGDVVELANYYINQLEKLNILNHKIILCGYSAGGVIAYFMAQQLPQTIKKLILFDAYFYAGSNYYQKVKNLVRAKLSLKIYISANSTWSYIVPKINTPILYFHATNDQMRDQYKLSKKIKFYYLRQMKANLEYYIFMLFRKFKLPNGLRRHMKIKKIHSLHAIHYGVDGILTSKYVPEIVQVIQNDIKDI
jgi:amino acid adenylation domain-containing protein